MAGAVSYSVVDYSNNIVGNDGSGISDLITGSVNVTLLNGPTLAQLKAINVHTTGSISLDVTNEGLSGTYADFAAAFNGTITPYTGQFTISNTGTLEASNLSSLDAKTSGLITATALTELTGTAVQVRAVTDSIAETGSNKFALGTMTGNVSDVNVSLSGSASLADLLAIDSKTSGSITAAGVDSLTGSVADILTVTNNLGSGSNKFSIGATTGSTTDVDITVTGSTLNASDLIAIDAKTTGTVSFSGEHATIAGTYDQINQLMASSGISKSSDFNVEINTVLSASGTSPVLDLISFLGLNTSGSISIIGTGDANPLNLNGADIGLTINGGAGNDVITGTKYADILTGGNGSDTFKFNAGDSGAISDLNFDTISDYATGVGGDKLDLVGTGAAATLSGTLDVADASGNTGQEILASISSGILTVGGIGAPSIDTLAEWLAVATAVDTADKRVVAFEFSGNTYVYQHNTGTDADLLIQLTSVTGVTGISATAAVNKLWIV